MRTARILTLLAALCIIGIGLCGAGLGILAGVLGTTEVALTLITLAVSFMVLTAGLGSVLATQTWQATQGRRSRPFAPQHPWLLGLTFVLAVLAGQAVLSLGLLPTLAFPPLHVAAAALPPLFIVALVSRALAGSATWREVILQASSGAFLSSSLSMVLELALILGLLFSLGALMTLRPGGLELIQALAARLEDPAWLQTPAVEEEMVAAVLRSPPILMSAFIIVAGIVPLLEEGVKSIGVVLFAYRRPTLDQTFLWGLTGGAGFALTEGLLNGATGLDAWLPTIAGRAGATLVHCATGSLMGIAWYHVLIKRRWASAIGLYGASVAIHALWNALSLAMTLSALSASSPKPIGDSSALAMARVAGALALLMLTTAVTAVGLGLLTRHVRKKAASVAAPPLQPFAPPSGKDQMPGHDGASPDIGDMEA